MKTEGHARTGKQRAILKALRSGNTRRAAAAAAGVHWDTLYEWLKEPTFSDAVMEAEANAEIKCVDTIHKAAVGGDWRAADNWLKKRRRDDWGDEINVRYLSDEELVTRAASALARDGSPWLELPATSDESPALSD